MAVVKLKLGQMPCLCCGHPVMVRKNDAGTLTAACDGCDVSMFAKAGTDAQRRWLRAVVPLPGSEPKEDSQKPSSEAPAATPPAQKPPLPAPPKAKPAGVFDFLGKGSAA